MHWADIWRGGGQQFELSYFKWSGARDFQLDKFHIRGREVSDLRFKFWKRVPRGKRIVARLIGLKIIEESKGFDIDILQYHPEVLRYKGAKGIIYLKGYWGSYKYYDSIKDTLKRDFQCKAELSNVTKEWRAKIVNDECETVSLHVRRGDYLATPINRDLYKVLPIAYYQECIARLKEKVPKLSLYIFSNDMEWAKAHLNFKGMSVQFVTGNNEMHGFEDMLLMWKCKHHIIANSTFSWWGAWLREQDGYTFAPSDWFNPSNQFNFHTNVWDTYPDDWIVVQV